MPQVIRLGRIAQPAHEAEAPWILQFGTGALLQQHCQMISLLIYCIFSLYLQNRQPISLKTRFILLYFIQLKHPIFISLPTVCDIPCPLIFHRICQGFLVISEGIKKYKFVYSHKIIDQFETCDVILFRWFFDLEAGTVDSEDMMVAMLATCCDRLMSFWKRTSYWCKLR